MNQLEQASVDLTMACADFNAVALSTTPPDQLERAVRSLMVSVESYCDTKRETVRPS